MDCPKCGFTNGADIPECLRCGVVFAKVHWVPADQADQMTPPADDAPAVASRRAAEADSHEHLVRIVALPLALALAWMLVRVAPAPVRFLTMWVHEAGHAVAAWLCGYMAFPGPWFTPVGSERSLSLTVVLVGVLAYGAVRAWQAARYGAVAASVVVIAVALVGTFGLHPGQAEQVIVFGGDAGCLVLGSALMLCMYATPDSPLRRDGLRWGLLPIGALAFMDVLLVWTGPIDGLPFGATDHGLSDPSVLSEMFGWSVITLTRRYQTLAGACFAGIAAVYALGLFGGSADTTRPSHARISRSWTAAPMPEAAGAIASSASAPDASITLMASNSSRAARSGSRREP